MSPDRASCAEYPLDLALRVADAATVLPALSAERGDKAACADLAAVDAFLRPAAQHVYDPDKFIAAIDALMAAGKNYDAAVLLTKHRREDHCSAAIVERLQKLADRMKGAPIARADLLTAAVNCSGGLPASTLATQLGVLDDELTAVGDPKRSASLALFSIGVSETLGSWEPLQAIALKPGFVERWESTYPEALGVALILDHGATILHGDPVRLEATAAQYELLCGGEPMPDRKAMCSSLASLRRKGTDDALRKVARDTLTALVQPNP